MPMLALFDDASSIILTILFFAFLKWMQGGEKKEQAESSEPAPARNREPAVEPDWQEVMRQILGGEPPPPKPAPAQPRPTTPPPIQSPRESAPLRTPVRPAQPPTLPASTTGFSKGRGQVAAKPIHAGTTAPVKLKIRTARRKRKSASAGIQWRKPGSARKAFIASVVFDPPKGFET